MKAPIVPAATTSTPRPRPGKLVNRKLVNQAPEAARKGKLVNQKIVKQAPEASQPDDQLFVTGRKTLLHVNEQADLDLEPRSHSVPAAWKMSRGWGEVESQKKDRSASKDSTYDGGSPSVFSQETQDEGCPGSKTRAAYLSDASFTSSKVCWADMADEDDEYDYLNFGAGVKSTEGPQETQQTAMPECKVRMIMITNLPASCTKDYLVKAMESLGFEGKQDYFMLPMRWSVHMGFAFIGFPDPDTTQQFAEHMAGFLLASPPGTSNDETSKIIPSGVQGLVNCQPRKS